MMISSVNEWTKCGKRLWQERLLTYGTLPLPKTLPIHNNFVTEDVLSQATHNLNEMHVPVRFLMKHEYDQENGKYCKMYRSKSPKSLRLIDYMDGTSKVRCQFLRAPTKQEIYTALGLPVSNERGSPCLKLTEWEVFACPTSYINFHGKMTQKPPFFEYELLLLDTENDDLFTGEQTMLKKPVEALITYEGNDRPPCIFTIPSKNVFPYYSGCFCSYHDKYHIVRYNDANGKPLRIDTGKIEDICTYQKLIKELYPAGTQYMKLCI